MKQKKKIFTKEHVFSFLMLTFGAVIAAFALEEFLVPNSIFDGGVVGISMIIHNKAGWGIGLGIVTLLLNIPFLMVGWRVLGHGFLLKAAYSMALFSGMTEVFATIPNATYETILGVCFGGVLLGAGVGLVLRGGGCLDGTEIVAILVSRKSPLTVGKIILIINLVIYTVAGFLFGLDKGMYSLLMYFITSKVIDFVENGLDSAKSVRIITDDGQEIADEIYRRLGRTVTFLKGEGYISGEQKDILYVVVTRAEIYEIKQIVEEYDKRSFATINDVSEILGDHIKRSGTQNPPKPKDPEKGVSADAG